MDDSFFCTISDLLDFLLRSLNGDANMQKAAKLITRFIGVLLLIEAQIALSPNPLYAADAVRVGLSALSLANGPLWVAQEEGLFKKYGIEPEIILVGGGATRAVSALLAGDLQFATAGGGAVMSATLSGGDVVMIAAGNNKGIQRLMVRPEI